MASCSASDMSVNYVQNNVVTSVYEVASLSGQFKYVQMKTARFQKSTIIKIAQNKDISLCILHIHIIM